MNTSRIYHGGSPLKSYFSFFNPGGGTVNDEKVKVSAADLTEDYLNPKIAAGDGIVKTLLNPGGNESLEIAHDGTSIVTFTDTTPGVLASKIVNGVGTTITVLNPGGAETLQISVPDIGKVLVSATDVTLSYLDLKIWAGAGITKTINNPGGSESITIASQGKILVSNDDTNMTWIENKFAAGSGISFATLNPGADEDFQISATGEIKCTAADTNYQYLLASLAAGSNITLTLLNPGGNETVEIAATGGGTGERETFIYSNAGALAYNTLIDAPNFGPFPAYGQGYHITVNKTLISLCALCNRWTSYSTDSIHFQMRYTSETKTSQISGTDGIALYSIQVNLANTGGAFRYYGGAGATGLSVNVPAGNFIFARCSAKSANSVTGVTLKAVFVDQ